jgi:hypothetical protein
MNSDNILEDGFLIERERVVCLVAILLLFWKFY